MFFGDYHQCGGNSSEAGEGSVERKVVHFSTVVCFGCLVVVVVEVSKFVSRVVKQQPNRDLYPRQVVTIVLWQGCTGSMNTTFFLSPLMPLRADVEAPVSSRVQQKITVIGRREGRYGNHDVI